LGALLEPASPAVPVDEGLGLRVPVPELLFWLSVIRDPIRYHARRTGRNERSGSRDTGRVDEEVILDAFLLAIGVLLGLRLGAVALDTLHGALRSGVDHLLRRTVLFRAVLASREDGRE